MFIRITTDTGLRGFAPGPADERAHRVIRGEIGPFLEGKDPRRWNAFAFTGSAASERVYRAVEIALMDAAARYEGCALSEVIGGRVRDRIKLIGSAGMCMSPERYADEAARFRRWDSSRTRCARRSARTRTSRPFGECAPRPARGSG